MTVTVDGPPGASADRLFDCLRDCGYTVTVTHRGRSSRQAAEVLAPYGEVDARSSFLPPEQLK